MMEHNYYRAMKWRIECNSTVECLHSMISIETMLANTPFLIELSKEGKLIARPSNRPSWQGDFWRSSQLPQLECQKCSIMFAAESERKIKSALDQLLQRQGGQVGQQGRRRQRRGSVSKWDLQEFLNKTWKALESRAKETGSEFPGRQHFCSVVE